MEEKDTSAAELRRISIVTIITIGSGTIFYHIVEKLSWLDSIYFCVVTLATVGYGDITPKTPLGKVFTIFYILIGIGIIAFFANTLLKRAYIRRMKRLRKKES